MEWFPVRLRFMNWNDERFAMTNEMIDHSRRYSEMWIEAQFRPEMREYCPRCGSELIAMYGVGWDYDRKVCGKRGCDYEIEFETTTDLYEHEPVLCSESKI
jgi:ribosomal protein S27AE